MSKSALTVLREARELISDPKRWTQHAYARAEDLSDIPPDNREAVCWCSIGAIARANDGPNSCVAAFFEARGYLISEIKRTSTAYATVSDFNDNVEHASVLRMFDAAIASAEKEGRS